MGSAEQLAVWVTDRGGIAHSAAVRAEGITMHTMRAAVERGLVVRVRRSWLAIPGCDEQLLRAAELGGRTTCLTEAARLKLWTPDHSDLHIAVPSTASRIDAEGVRLHWSRGPSPVVGTAVQDPIINVLHHVARCAPLVDALAVWESAIRKKAVAPEVLAGIEWGSESGRRLASLASELSDSGLETHLASLMRAIGVEVRQQVWIDDHPLDALIGEYLAVQLDGFAHHQGRDRRRDIRADARLVLRGYTVLRFDYLQVLFHPEEVIAIVSTAIAQGLHVRRRP